MKETTATNTVYEIGGDRFFGPIRVEKTSGNETSVILSIDPEELIIMNREEFSQVCEAVKKLMGWESEAGHPSRPHKVREALKDASISIATAQDDMKDGVLKILDLEDIQDHITRLENLLDPVVALPPETPPKLVLVDGEVCNSGKAGTVAQSEMNSEEYADCEGDADRLADTFGDCLVLDREDAQVMYDCLTPGIQGTFDRKAGRNALEYFDATN